MEQQQKTIKEEILDSDANKSSDSSMNTKKKRKKSKLNSDEIDDNSMATLVNCKSDNNDEMSMMMMIMNDGVNNGVVETELLELSNDTVITGNYIFLFGFFCIYVQIFYFYFDHFIYR